MALDTRISTAAQNAAVDAVKARLNNGYIRLYSGTRPAGPGTALSGNTLLAELRFGATAFGASTGGSASANAITPDAAADASGTATFARLLQSDGTTAEADIEVGTSGANLNLNTVGITAGQSVSISSLSLSIPANG